MEDLEQLIHAAQKGDTQAFGKIYNLFYKRIYRYCYINCYNNTEAAQDLCQETFLKAWKTLHNFSLAKGGSMQAYLFRIARNLIIDQSRKKKEIALDEELEIESHETFEDDIDKKKDEDMLHQAMNRLDELDRQIVVLRYFEELSFSEVAKALSINEGALRVRAHRVLKKIKDIIEKERK